MKSTQWSVVLALASTVAYPFAARAADEPRTIEMTVTAKGFEPSRVKLVRGQPVKLVITRKTDETCATAVQIPDENLKADLPLNKPVTLTFTPKRSGEIKYSCAMGMIGGVMVVQ